MLIATLIILNIPVYLLIGWVLFDTKEGAADTFLETIVFVIKAALLPRFVRVLMGDDDTDGVLGLFPIAIFFGGCIAIVWGEFHLITKYLL